MDKKSKEYLMAFVRERLSFMAVKTQEMRWMETEKFFVRINEIEAEIAEEIIQKVTNEVLQSIGEEK